MPIRSQERKNNYQESTESVSENIVSPVLNKIVDLGEQDVMVASPLRAMSPRVENSVLECLRASLKEENNSEMKGQLMES